MDAVVPLAGILIAWIEVARHSLPEAIDKWLGHIDRVFTMLLNGGHLAGVRGVAIGHFTRCMSHGEWTYLDVLRDRLGRLGVPILGGLPFGHDPHAYTIPFGAMATLDTTTHRLTIAGNERPNSLAADGGPRS
jgi:muramoyltetrapeptide carboxypeptidase